MLSRLYVLALLVALVAASDTGSMLRIDGSINATARIQLTTEPPSTLSPSDASLLDTLIATLVNVTKTAPPANATTIQVPHKTIVENSVLTPTSPAAATAESSDGMPTTTAMLVGIVIGVAGCALIAAAFLLHRRRRSSLETPKPDDAVASPPLPTYEAQETSRVSGVLFYMPGRRRSSAQTPDVRESSVHALPTGFQRPGLRLDTIAHGEESESMSTLFATTTSVRSVMSYSNGSPNYLSPVHGSTGTACASTAQSANGFFIARDGDSFTDAREFQSILTRPTMDSVGSSMFTPRGAPPAPNTMEP
ncbi:hypothetical protein SPRG_01236 [Saprolegnia parasitica CBS 223.65]|uniref:Mid2 domain-containing protein n=1 Tax=Saprolegnia parasitica (strain CBS 223.65) TaxID=695850 RepID=A0A067CTV6_SAPPC|nr:hypothetical protein SPRG_01236 [Saprolegnia parasitica CBS 223.65]KDO33958.1 hypothetical protein SPRG_01236 [Saprolegnia parasitica CBS 223.65]|eukprot:XP_012194851.1 hypothetical protein SPRG_01236 [Saprolegnia parasitica CBS 223.65]